MAYEDRNLTCVECNSEFVFSADDQQFHAEREYQDPKRCPSCRQAKRAGGGGGGGGYGGGGSRQMHDAVCADCGSACQVPFMPTQDRPVYCSDCFSKHKPSR
ncbi:MAG: zinc-ribbon domain containing protein [Chloroflexi bacterium]|nr:zinc-ribbon domain containing protein [Chloroflexota bacterium]